MVDEFSSEPPPHYYVSHLMDIFPMNFISDTPQKLGICVLKLFNKCIYFNWRLITLKHRDYFCYTST